MPKINKSRIINLLYNGDNTFLQDEIYDYFEGENTLILLKNGGGKSVLTQFLMQPILPNLKLGERKTIDHFISYDKPPTYILLEWKLENGSYLLCGIGLEKVKKSSSTDNEKTETMDYFTFISGPYSTQNDFNIDNFPLTKQTDRGLEIKSFNATKEMIKHNRDKFNIKYFRKDELKEYRHILDGFNINHKEWSSFHTKVNGTEGDLKSLFKNCTKSRALLEEWFIDAVEKKLGEHNFSELLDNYVSKEISVEKDIKNKQEYLNFKEYLKGIYDRAIKYQELALDLYNLENELKKIYFYSNEKKINSDNTILEKKSQISDAENELNDIEYEELSFKYHEIYDEFKEIEKQYNELEIDKDLLKKESNVAEQNKNYQFAAEYYQEINDIKADIKENKAKKRKIAGENLDLNKEINYIKYSLFIKYKELLDDIKEKERTLKNELDNVDELLKEKTIENENIVTKISNVKSQIAVIETEIKAFKQNEKKLKTNHNIEIVRNLLEELTRPIKNIINDTFSNLEHIKLEKEDNNDRLNKTIEETEHLEQDERSKNEERINTKNAIELCEEDINKYTKELSKYKDHLLKYQISKYNLFDKEYILKILDQKNNNYKKIERDLTIKTNDLSNFIKGIEDNNLYVDKQLIELLENEGIDFQTGIEFLNTNVAFKNNQHKEKILKENPLIPFSIIIEKYDINKLEEMKLDLNLRNVVPVFTKDDLSNINLLNKNNFAVIDNIKFIFNFDKKIFNIEDILGYKEELEKKKQELEDELNNISNSITNISESFVIIKSFNYGPDYLTKKQNELSDFKTKHESIEAELKALKNKINDNKSKIELLRNEDKLYDQSITDTNIMLSDLKEFDIDNNKYVANFKKKKEYSNELERLNKTREELGKEIKYSNGLINSIKQKSWNTQNEYTLNNEKLNLYKNSNPVDDISKDSILELEAVLKQYSSKLTYDSIEEIDNVLAKLTTRLTKNNKELEILNIGEEDYINLKYSIEEKSKYQAQCKKLTGEMEEIIKELSSCNAKKDNLELKLNANKELIHNKYESQPKEKSEIRDINFNAQKHIIEAQINNFVEDIGKLKDIYDFYEKIMNRIIENSIDISEKTDFTEIYYEKKQDLEIHINKIFTNRNKIKEELFKYDNEINNSLKNMVDKYSDSITEIATFLFDFEKHIKSDSNYKKTTKMIEETFVKLDDILQLIKSKEKTLSDERDHISKVIHGYIKNVFDELKRIDKISKVSIYNKKISMLKIKLDPISNLAEEQIKNYLESCSLKIKELKENGEEHSKIKRKIEDYVSTKEILNQVSRLDNCKIYAYKIDKTPENSRHKIWKEARKANSGGEEFVVFFTVFATLLSYYRGNSIEEDDKVAIMDNPFGPITSEHLLKPLFAIAKKYKMQLICFTDIDKNTVKEQFDVIYQLVDKKLTNNKEFIVAELEKSNVSTLDKAIYRAKKQQIKFTV